MADDRYEYIDLSAKKNVKVGYEGAVIGEGLSIIKHLDELRDNGFDVHYSYTYGEGCTKKIMEFSGTLEGSGPDVIEAIQTLDKIVAETKRSFCRRYRSFIVR